MSFSSNADERKKIINETKFVECNTYFSKSTYILSCCNLHYLFPCDSDGYLWWCGTNYDYYNNNCSYFCCCLCCLSLYSESVLSLYNRRID